VNCYVASSDVASSVVASCVVANCVVASCYVANCMGIVYFNFIILKRVTWRFVPMAGPAPRFSNIFACVTGANYLVLLHYLLSLS
jgi:hypothetical protein